MARPYQRRVGARSEDSISSFSCPALLAAATGWSDMLTPSSLEVSYRWVGSQSFQQPESPRASGQAGNAAQRIGQVAENQGFGRAGLGAGRLHLSVAHQSA